MVSIHTPHGTWEDVSWSDIYVYITGQFPCHVTYNEFMDMEEFKYFCKSIYKHKWFPIGNEDYSQPQKQKKVIVLNG